MERRHLGAMSSQMSGLGRCTLLDPVDRDTTQENAPLDAPANAPYDQGRCRRHGSISCIISSHFISRAVRKAHGCASLIVTLIRFLLSNSIQTRDFYSSATNGQCMSNVNMIELYTLHRCKIGATVSTQRSMEQWLNHFGLRVCHELLYCITSLPFLHLL
jgi:hypothetical protein